MSLTNPAAELFPSDMCFGGSEDTYEAYIAANEEPSLTAQAEAQFEYERGLFAIMNATRKKEWVRALIAEVRAEMQQGTFELDAAPVDKRKIGIYAMLRKAAKPLLDVISRTPFTFTRPDLMGDYHGDIDALLLSFGNAMRNYIDMCLSEVSQEVLPMISSRKFKNSILENAGTPLRLTSNALLTAPYCYERTLGVQLTGSQVGEIARGFLTPLQLLSQGHQSHIAAYLTLVGGGPGVVGPFYTSYFTPGRDQMTGMLSLGPEADFFNLVGAGEARMTSSSIPLVGCPLSGVVYPSIHEKFAIEIDRIAEQVEKDPSIMEGYLAIRARESGVLGTTIWI